MDLYALIILLISLVTLTMLGYISGQGLNNRVNKAFFIFTALIFLNQFTHFLLWSEIGAKYPIQFIKLNAISWGLLGAASCNIAYAMVGRKKDLFLDLSIIVSGFIVVFTLTTGFVVDKYEILPWGVQITTNAWFHVCHGITIGILPLVAITIITIHRFKTDNPHIKRHLSFFMLGAILTFVTTIITNILLGLFLEENNIPPIGTHSMIFLISCILYSMIRYQFLNQSVESFTKKMLHNSNDGVIILDANFYVMYMNETSKLHFNKQEASTFKITEIFPDFTLTLSGEIEKIIEFRGEEITLRMNITKLISPLSDPLYIIFTRDTTYKKAMQKLEFEKKKAEELGRERSRFLSNIQHEFMTPMHAILNFSKFGQKNSSEKKLTDYFLSIHTAGISLYSLLTDLLQIALIESGSNKYNFKQNDLQDAVDVAIEKSRIKINEKNLKIKTQVNSADTRATFDNQLLTLAVEKILQNAVKYSSPDTEIILKIEDSKININGWHESIILSITDTGFLIPINELKTIFNSFYESTKTRTNAGGIGIGLALCKQLINDHNGTITASSCEEAKTTTIEINIPKHYNKNNGANSDKTDSQLQNAS